MTRFLIGACLALVLLGACEPATRSPAVTSTPPVEAAVIHGTVFDEDGVVIPGAVVRVKTTDLETVTDSDGRFALTWMTSDEAVALTAWSPGYYIGGGIEIQPDAADVVIILTKHVEVDNSEYEFLSAFSIEGKEGNCQNCHAGPANSDTALPFSEWQADAHSQSARNPRFLSMYLGRDLDGNQSSSTLYGFNRDYGRFPLRPDPNQEYFGPGYKLDFPDTAGNCAACHAPVAAIDEAYGADPTRLRGVAREGVTCDFCHKVWDVRLHPTSGLPQANMPGVLSFEFRRPPEGHQFFAGPFDDVAPGEDTYTPIQRQSQYCAPCHFGSFWDTQIYNSFGEWLESPYSSENGKTCQDCHMPPGQNDHFARFELGGARRDPATIFSHRMPGASDVVLLQNAVTLTVDAKLDGDQLVVEVRIVNDKTGHHIPTDSPLRQMILMVEARGAQGQVLSLQSGPTIPAWGGVGSPADGYYASLPGKVFAKVLMELWTEITPTGAYWNRTRIVNDNRIPAFGSDTSEYVFEAPKDSPANIKVILLFRRAFKELMDQKGWKAPDIVMTQETLQVKK